jgi:hypothetical protein
LEKRDEDERPVPDLYIVEARYVGAEEEADQGDGGDEGQQEVEQAEQHRTRPDGAAAAPPHPVLGTNRIFVQD